MVSGGCERAATDNQFHINFHNINKRIQQQNAQLYVTNLYVEALQGDANGMAVCSHESVHAHRPDNAGHSFVSYREWNDVPQRIGLRLVYVTLRN